MFVSSKFLGAVVMPMLAVLTLSACGSGGDSAPATVPVDTDLEVRAVPGLRFERDAYEAEAGEISVAYVNDDTIRHNLVVIKDGVIDNSFELVINRKGDVDTGSITLEPGNYVLFCTVPGHQNMKADLVVK
jgi:plastocyanin